MPSALDYFNIQPPGNPLSQFFPQQGGDDAFRAQLEERPRGGAGLPPELALGLQTGDPMGFMDQIQKSRASIQSQNIIKGLQDLDFGSKDYLSPGITAGKNSLGVVTRPRRGYCASEFFGKQAQDNSLSDDAGTGHERSSTSLTLQPHHQQDYRDLIKKTNSTDVSNQGFDRLLRPTTTNTLPLSRRLR